MKDMNVSVEVESGLKQLKNGGEVVIDKLKVKRVSIADSLKSKFVYNVGGYHHTSIPSQLQPELQFAHPSPLSPNISTKISTSTINNLVLGLAKLTRLLSCLFTHCLVGLHGLSLCLRNNMNNSQSVTTSTNDTSSNSSNNDYNLQSINIENRLYDNMLSNCTHD